MKTNRILTLEIYNTMSDRCMLLINEADEVCDEVGRTKYNEIYTRIQARRRALQALKSK